ncbi:unnamed protein product [Moneuplotes crassus]|uniref:Uncharacterized protein n=1 Tax=Euplotes crassus TaxID=5936 RepID=A0AAD1Y6V4_EUPCR|nr:unnamed protein product [Moneuplotes crassus]
MNTLREEMGVREVEKITSDKTPPITLKTQTSALDIRQELEAIKKDLKEEDFFVEFCLWKVCEEEVEHSQAKGKERRVKQEEENSKEGEIPKPKKEQLIKEKDFKIKKLEGIIKTKEDQLVTGRKRIKLLDDKFKTKAEELNNMK